MPAKEVYDTLNLVEAYETSSIQNWKKTILLWRNLYLKVIKLDGSPSHIKLEMVELTV